MPPYPDRHAAGVALAGLIAELAERGGLPTGQHTGAEPLAGVAVFALPRGGVPVAIPVAAALDAEARLLLVRKLGLPGHPELAMGALAGIGGRVRVVGNDAVLHRHRVTDQEWEAVLDAERTELSRRIRRFGEWTAPDPDGRPVLLVDDGLATGSTMAAAAEAVRSAGGGPVLAAVPVTSPEAERRLQASGIGVLSLTRPDPMIAVGEAYRDFHQLDDAEVLELLAGQRRG